MATKTSKVVELSEKLTRRLESREWAPGEQLPSRQEVAAEHNVSPATVSNALKILSRKRLIRTVPGKGVFVVDPRQPHLMTQKNARKPVIALAGCYVPQKQKIQSNGIQAVSQLPILDGVWATAAEMGCHLVLLTESRQGIDLQQVDELGVKGLVVLGGYKREELLKIRNADIPAILANGTWEPCPLNYVDYDNATLMHDTVHEFASRGHQRIAFISTETSVAGYLDWMQLHFVRALLDNNLIYNYNDYWRSRPVNIQAGPSAQAYRETGAKLVEDLLALPEPPTAIFCYQQLLLEGVEDALKRHGLRVPQDVSLIVSYDWNEQAAYSGFDNPHAEKGRELLRNLLWTMNNRQHYCQKLIGRQFIDRGSVADRGSSK